MAEAEPEAVGRARWATLAGVAVFALIWAVNSVGAQGGSFLTQDYGAQYHLAELTAHGAIPLVDFQHGWNAGSWWVSALLFKIAQGSPTIWFILWGRLLGGGLAAVAGAAIALRLRLHPVAMVAIAVGVTMLAQPAHIKYALPVVWVLALLPGAWLDSRPRLAVALRVLVPILMFWQYVELAVLLTGASGLFELLGRREAPWRTRLVRCGQLAAGFALGLVSQALVYRLVWGLSFSSFNQQVVLGQSETAPGDAQYAVWDFFHLSTVNGGLVTQALYPFALLLPFVPVLWRRISDGTRLVALAALVLVVVPIRRVDDSHITTVSTLVLIAVVLAVAELPVAELPAAGGARVSWRPGRAWLLPVLLVVAGAVWAAATLLLGFGVRSMLGGPVIVVLALAGALSGRLLGRRALAASVGALLVLGCLPAAAAVSRVRDLHRDETPYATSDAIAAALRPELARCAPGVTSALVLPNYLQLYDALGLTNPTPYYLFHYDIANHRADLLRRLGDHSVPVIIQTMPLHTPQPWLVSAVRARYTACAVVHVPRVGMTVTVWTDNARG